MGKMLTLIGLGSAENHDGLSVGAWEALRRTEGPKVARSRAHPAVQWLESEAGGVGFTAAFDELTDAEAVEQVLDAARLGNVVYVVPGHPLMGDPTGIPLVEAARRETIPLRVFAPAPPPSDSPTDLEALVGIMARLRDPQTGCPWDREQTPISLRKYLIEEAYEVVEAIDSGIPAKLSEELGDLLLQVVFHAQLAHESDQFALPDVIRAIVEKLIRRHPHVFGTVTVSGTDQVLQNWEQIKRAEPGYEDRVGILDGIPPALPALMRALEVSKRVVKVGFEWPSVAEVLDKVEEEITELRAEIASRETARAADELGDLLFTLVNVARQLGVDPEDALRKMTQRFATRFRYIENFAAESNRAVAELSLAEMETVWQTAKREE
jgi:MazG family protein